MVPPTTRRIRTGPESARSRTRSWWSSPFAHSQRAWNCPSIGRQASSPGPHVHTSSARWTSLALRPPLRPMQDSQDDDLFLANLVDGNERERRKGNLPRAVNATRTSEVRERFQCADTFDHGLRHSSGGLGAIL